MTTIRMTIKYVNAPKEGKARGSIRGEDGTFIGVHASKLSQFTPGKTYDVEYTETGEWKTLTRATEVAVAASLTNGSPGHTGQSTAFRTPEQMTVAEITCAYIAAGKCANPGELRQIMRAICDAFRATWPDTEHYAQAAE